MFCDFDGRSLALRVDLRSPSAAALEQLSGHRVV
jgi:hypothetical protein